MRVPLSTSFDLEFWEHKLARYHDRHIIDFMRFGWPINFAGNFSPAPFRGNHNSAHTFASHVDEFIQSELHHGSLFGPFDANPFHPQHCFISPLQTVPKKGSPHKRRVVVDLSFPSNQSVNSGISNSTYLDTDIDFELPSVDTFAHLIRQKGKGCFLFKRDLSRAYRQIPIDPHDYNLLGISWNEQLYFDSALPFGLRSAAFICQSVSSALSFMQISDGFDCINYIDDFAGAESSVSKAVHAFDNLATIFSRAGICEAKDKAVAPCQVMSFLGVGFNTVSMTMFVTAERLAELHDLSSLYINASKITKAQLQSLIGKLMFAAKCVPSSRIFIHRLLNVLRKLKHRSYRIRIDSHMKRDLFWWSKFLPAFNGISIIPDLSWSEPDSVIQCDACLTGAGGAFGNSAFHRRFPVFILEQNLHINALELLTVTVALKLWAPQLAGKKIQILCDNLVSVQVINKGNCSNEFMQTCMRELIFVLSLHNVQLRAVHISGESNRLADLLSRVHLNHKYRDTLRTLAPNLSLTDVTDDIFKFQNRW